MVRINEKIKVGDLIDGKVAHEASIEVSKLHQRAKLNTVEAELKHKSLEKEIKEKVTGEIKSSGYRESKAPKIDKVDFIVIDENGKKITKEEALIQIEKKSLEDHNIEGNIIDISVPTIQPVTSIVLPNITILNGGLNGLTNKEKIISYWGKDINTFDHQHEAVQFSQKILMLELAKKYGADKDLHVMYLKTHSGEHYGRADSLYFDKNYYYSEQDKFLCYKNNLLTYPLTSEKIWHMYLINEGSDRIYLSVGNRSEFQAIIKYLRETDEKLPSNLIVNDLSPFNEVDPNFDSDNFIKFTIDKYLNNLNLKNNIYSNAEKFYLYDFNNTKFKWSSKSDLQNDFNTDKSIVENIVTQYSWNNKYEKTLDFNDYKTCETFECKAPKGLDDNLNIFQGYSWANHNSLKTVDDFRFNMTTCASRSINKNDIDDGNLN